MVKLLDRYMLRELIFPFVLANLGFLIFALLLMIGAFSQNLIAGVLPTDQMIMLLLYRVPMMASYGLPFATLFAIFLALGRLGHDREVIAMQASGASLRRIVRPFLIFGFIIALLTLWLNDTLVPLGNQQFVRQYYNVYLYGERGPELAANQFFKAGDEDIYIYAKSSGETGNVLLNVMIYENSERARTEEGNYPRIITAERAEWVDQSWQLYDTRTIQLTQL